MVRVRFYDSRSFDEGGLTLRRWAFQVALGVCIARCICGIFL